MQRDILRSIKEFMYGFEQMKRLKITQKNLSDGNIMMQFLSILDYKYFNPGEISKGRSVQNISSHNNNNGQYNNKGGSTLLLQGPILEQGRVYYLHNNNSNENRQLDLLTKLKNWKTIISKLKEYFRQQHQKGIKYSDIDIVDLSKNHSIEQLSKVFQLVLCVVANCGYKQQCIQKIMQLQQSTQHILAQLMSTALESRLCTLQNQQRADLLEQLTYKQQQMNSLYEQIQHLQEQNMQLSQQLAEYQKISTQIQYQKQKILLFNKRNPQININTFNSLIDKNQQTSIMSNMNHNYGNNNHIDNSNNNNINNNKEYDESILQQSQYIQQLSQQHIHYTRAGQISLIQSLKNKLIRQQQAHQQQVLQLQQKIQQLQQQLKQSEYLEQLLLVYQQKYQQALAYVQKVSQYEKEKNKINEEMIEKDLIIEQLTNTINQLNQRLVQIQQEKIDLQLLLVKKNSQKKMIKNNYQHKNHIKNYSLAQNNQSLYFTQLPENTPTLKKSQTLPQQQQQQIQQNKLYLTHNYQKSQQISNLYNNNNNKLSLSMYPYMIQDNQQQQSNNIQQLQIKIQTQNLQIVKLKRKQKQLLKSIQLLKNKLTKMKNTQSENIKLSNIILQLHSTKNQQTQIIMACLYQTYKQYHFKFNRLIGAKDYSNKSYIKDKDQKGQCLQNGFKIKQNVNGNKNLPIQVQKINNDINNSIEHSLINQSQSYYVLQQDSQQNQVNKINL